MMLNESELLRLLENSIPDCFEDRSINKVSSFSETHDEKNIDIREKLIKNLRGLHVTSRFIN